jgi:hypothetical protein
MPVAPGAIQQSRDVHLLCQRFFFRSSSFRAVKARTWCAALRPALLRGMHAPENRT